MPTGYCRLESQLGFTADSGRQTIVSSLPAVLTAYSPAAVAARRLAGSLARLLCELALGVAGLLGGSGAVEGARLAVELAGAG